jgi:hypothetical protein
MQYYKLFDSFSYDPRTRRAQLEILTQNKDPELKKFVQFYDRNKSIKYELFHDVILMTDEQQQQSRKRRTDSQRIQQESKRSMWMESST